MRLFFHNDHLCIGHRLLRVKISLFFFGLLRNDQLCDGCRVFGFIVLLYCFFGFLEIFLLFSFFFLTLKELKGRLFGCKKINMQDYQIEQEEGKNGHSSSNNPRQDNSQQLRLVSIINVETCDCGMYDECNSIAESGYDANKEKFIVFISNAIVKPHAVVIEVTDTSVTNSAVLAVSHAIAIAVEAEEEYVIIRNERYGFVMQRPFVIVDHFISRIYHCCQSSTAYHN